VSSNMAFRNKFLFKGANWNVRVSDDSADSTSSLRYCSGIDHTLIDEETFTKVIDFWFGECDLENAEEITKCMYDYSCDSRPFGYNGIILTCVQRTVHSKSCHGKKSPDALGTLEEEITGFWAIHSNGSVYMRREETTHFVLTAKDKLDSRISPDKIAALMSALMKYPQNDFYWYSRQHGCCHSPGARYYRQNCGYLGDRMKVKKYGKGEYSWGRSAIYNALSQCKGLY